MLLNLDISLGGEHVIQALSPQKELITTSVKTFLTLKFAGILAFDFKVSRNVRDKFYVYKLPKYSVIAAQRE